MVGDLVGCPPHHYDQIFTVHGVIMIFFVAMPLVTGFMNYVVPLQIGARDVAFPFLNNSLLDDDHRRRALASLFVGEFNARTARVSAAVGIISSPDAGVDYYIWSLQTSARNAGYRA